MVDETQQIGTKKVTGLLATPGHKAAVKPELLREIEKDIAERVRKGLECKHNSRASAKGKIVELVKVVSIL